MWHSWQQAMAHYRFLHIQVLRVELQNNDPSSHCSTLLNITTVIRWWLPQLMIMVAICNYVSHILLQASTLFHLQQQTKSKLALTSLKNTFIYEYQRWIHHTPHHTSDVHNWLNRVDSSKGLELGLGLMPVIALQVHIYFLPIEYFWMPS